MTNLHTRIFEIPDHIKDEVEFYFNEFKFDSEGYPTIDGVRIDTNDVCPPNGLIYDIPGEIDDYPWGWDEHKIHEHPKYNIWLFNYGGDRQQLLYALRRLWIYKHLFDCEDALNQV